MKTTDVHTAADLGRVVRDARRRCSLTQQALALRAGLAQPTISKIERGASDVSFATLVRLCAVLGLGLAIGPRATGDASPWDDA